MGSEKGEVARLDIDFSPPTSDPFFPLFFLLGQTGPVQINNSVESVDPEKMAANFGGQKAVKAGEIEYREYYE